MLLNIEKKTDCEGKRISHDLHWGKQNTQAKRGLLTNKTQHNNLIYTMFLFYFFFGDKWKLKDTEMDHRFGTLRNLLPCRLSCELRLRLSPWTLHEQIHTYPLFTGSHYDTWRRILRLSLYWYLRLVTLPGLRLVLFSNSCVGSFTSYKNQISQKVLWDGTYGFSSLSEKTRKSNRLQMSLQR